MLIGVTPQSRSTEGSFRTRIWGLLKPYLRALESQGAGIVILPPQESHRLPAILHRLDALLLPGGVDLDPAHFGEEPLPQLGEVSPERDAMELFVARYTAQQGIPTLGIAAASR
jgi:putative glutamine amidotransferase